MSSEVSLCFELLLAACLFGLCVRISCVVLFRCRAYLHPVLCRSILILWLPVLCLPPPKIFLSPCSFRVGLCSCFSAESFSRSGFLIRVSVLLFPKRSSAVQFSFTQIGAGYFLLGVFVFASASCLRSGVLWNCVFFSARGRFSFGPLRSCRFFV
jgi:hypothetical protein